MVGPLLTTKLHAPRRRRGLVARARLLEQLSRGDEAVLTLVSAPAGFGKTTLLTEWLAAAGRPSTAWLALDQRDDDPVLFLTYLLSALQRAAQEVGGKALTRLQEPHASIDEVLAILVNELDALEDDIVLVLDDYHVVSARDVHEAMTFLLEHSPSRMHLVIATRADPALPLSRLRARGELVEVRADDLRFTADEAAAYLNEAMGLALTAEQVVALEARTEGWIAALQLAALSLKGRDDVAGFIAGFAGDDRYIVDYLIQEVLQRQPEHVRRFLLQTSVLERLSGSLCDAVTGGDGGKATLQALDGENLFLVRLDDRRHWYRYHHLFADVLQAHLRDEWPDQIADLHRRASAWFERNGERSEAIRHALAAADHARAADLVELAIPELGQGRQEATLRRWMEALPEELFEARPVLSAGYVGALMSTGDVEGVEARLRDAERWLDRTAPSADMIVADDEAWGRLPAQIAMYRAGHALVHGDVAGSMGHARRALELAGPDDHLGRGGPAAILGLAYWTTGDLDAAHRWYAEGMASLDEGGYRSDVIGGAITLADIRIAQGRLREAMRTYQQGLQRAQQCDPPLRGAADMHVGMSQLLLERNDLEAARHHLRRSQELGDHGGLPKNPYRRRLAMARLHQLDGDIEGALELLDEAERWYNSDFSPDVQPIPAVRARMWIAHGRLESALHWAREHGLSADDDLDYVGEYEHITLARALLAQHAASRDLDPVDQATGLLERLLHAAQDGGRTGSVLEILVLQALACQALADVPAAEAALRRALTLAEPEGYVRIFVDEGLPMASLLRAAATREIASGYVRRLLAAIDATQHDGPIHQDALVEPLSKRELDVLRLLGTELDGPEIARELFVSLNTVRTHTRNIYAKLGVNNRRAAVRRAADLNLLSPAPQR
ncbi:LuxR C-terminal-related transcriptional regulator [Geodermatophilus sp. YIM 151500]|uniref:LuxR C-terminal-related transcriptional regulator n=1 Tax=Geodermatophilus sp. YIM 151500 TaxID=2984531 RepID=UPI0021E39B3B|nr:LuxR C-terminal-related transcriptional regulator [Geodermatophilus sp. YIM 151500]MCV2490969.1 LuxR C-terminal-related transcriptional regulator [Geodermatophilus sp. YIM 151500]